SAASTGLTPGGVDTASTAAATSTAAAADLHHAIAAAGVRRRRSTTKRDSAGRGGLNLVAPDSAPPPLSTKGTLATGAGAATTAAVWHGDREKKRHSLRESAAASLPNPDISSPSISTI
ncbi:unnamed protein product, partial [Laminaria digitata]